MSALISLAFAALAAAFALASLASDYRRAREGARNIRLQLEQAKGQQIRWTVRQYGKGG